MSLDACNETILAEKLVAMKGTVLPEKACPVTSCSSGGSSSVVLSKSEKLEQPVLVAVAPVLVMANESFTVTATVYNEQFREQTFNVSAYVYSGSKNYTSREPQEIIVDPFSEEGVSFDLVSDLEPGEYSLKVKALKEGRKTPYEERRTIMFSAPARIEPFVEVVMEKEPEEIQEINSLVPITGSVLAVPPKKPNKLWLSVILAGTLLLLSRFMYSRK